MKTISRLGLVVSGCLLLLSVTAQVQAQTLARESVGSVGGSHHVSGLFMQSAIGQVYSTHAFLGYRPGFLQPLQTSASASSLSLKIKVYPNPATSFLTIESDQTMVSGRVEVRDIYGKLIHQQSFENQRTQQVDCAAWTVGAYFITVTDRNSKVHSSKLIKSN